MLAISETGGKTVCMFMSDQSTATSYIQNSVQGITAWTTSLSAVASPVSSGPAQW